MNLTVTTAAGQQIPFVQAGDAKLLVQNLGPGNLFIETIVQKPAVSLTATTGVRIPTGGQVIFTSQESQSGPVQVISDSTCDVRYTSL